MGASERVDDLLEIVNDLLELAKMREGRVRAPWAHRVYINQVLADIFDAIGPLAQERRVELVPDMDGVALLDWGVPPDLVYVFENLIDNAIEYSHEGGEVRVRLRVEDDVATVEVGTRGSASPGTSCPTFSWSLSAHPTPRSTLRAAPVLACPSSARASRCTAVTSRWRAIRPWHRFTVSSPAAFYSPEVEESRRVR